MSASRQFATLTADLLVRKGEARPSAALAFEESSDAWREPHGSFHAPTMARTFDRSMKADAISTEFPPATSSQPHRVSLTLTKTEFERLGIAGVKLGINRKQMFRRAIDFYLEKLETDYRSSCQCISKNPNGCGRNAD